MLPWRVPLGSPSQNFIHVLFIQSEHTLEQQLVLFAHACTPPGML